MIQWSQIPDKTVIKEEIIRTSAVIKEYAQANPKQTGIGAGFAAAGVLLWIYGPDLRHRFFAWLNNKFAVLKQEEYENFKKTAFSSLKYLTSHDPKLREEKTLRILEIGAGVGANFSMYPDNTRLVVADPNPYFEKYFNEHKAKFPNVKCETIIVAKGEDIDMVRSESIDAVVTTLVLCSVDDVAKVISQVKRVLVPGGKYIFVEHIKEWDKKNHWMRRHLQNILSWSGFWPFTFDGCYLNRNPQPVIEAVGFSEVTVQQDYAPMPAAFMMVASPHIKGVATK